MPRKSISGFAEAGAAMAQQLDDNDLLNLFSAVGRVVSKRFLMKRPCLNSWQLVLDYLKSAMGFEPREQFRVLYLDKRNNLIADEVLAEGTVDHTPVYPREVLRRAIELHATGCVLVHNHPSGDATPSRAFVPQASPGPRNTMLAASFSHTRATTATTGRWPSIGPTCSPIRRTGPMNRLKMIEERCQIAHGAHKH
jgi:hypothetical protein